MTGRTNIIPITEPAITDEIVELSQVEWKVHLTDSAEHFQKIIYANHIYMGITASGSIIWTTDSGETWHTKKVGDYVFTDIFWDGTLFIVCGYSGFTGVIISTADGREVTVKADYSNAPFVGGTYKDGIYYFISCYNKTLHTWTGTVLADIADTGNTINAEPYAIQYVKFMYANGRFLLAYMYSYSSTTTYNILFSSNGLDFTDLVIRNNTTARDTNIWLTCINRIFYVYVADELYKSITGSTWSKISGLSNLKGLISFNNQLLLVGDKNKGIIVNQGESIAEKTINDYKVIMDEVVITTAVSAEDKIMIGCQGGVALSSKQKNTNPDTVAVQTMSAKKALADANQYTDSQIRILRDYIDGLLNTFSTDV